MKICKIHLENHPFFGNLDIDLVDAKGNPLNTIVFAGINGSGKTTVLNKIYSMLEINVILLKKTNSPLRDYSLNKDEQKSYMEIDFSKFESALLEKNFETISNFLFSVVPYGDSFLSLRSKNPENLDKFPKCALLPTEIKFDEIKISNAPYEYKYSFFNLINEQITSNIPDYFGTYIDRIIYSNENTTPKVSIQKACEEINSIFEILDLESRLTGLKKDGSRMPIFTNKSGEEFEISSLSSGEKQLFFRIIALKMIEVNNSIILIDEPEISLHPAWQQKVLKVYENIGKNNQVIVATHSPHIIGSTNKENVKLLVRDEKNKRFRILGYDDISVTKGATTERILKDLMGLKTTRDPDIQIRIDRLWEQIKKNNYNSSKFKKEFKSLENLIEPIDEDLISMKLEIGKKNWEKQNAKNK